MPDKRSIKNFVRKIHLVLGLSTGVIVFLVALTGCLYVFQEEITSLYDDHHYVEAQKASFISPSQAHEIAGEVLPGRHVHSVIYGDKTEALEVVYYEADPEFYQKAFINPYSGDLIKVVDLEAGFFHFVLEGHIHLWMGEFGRQLIGYSTLIFLVILITGLFLWWPRNKKVATKKMKFSWSDRTRWKRKNYDLHNILGFYASLVAMVIAITGVSMAFNWFSGGIHALTGGEKKTQFVLPQNVSEKGEGDTSGKPVDIIWRKMMQEYPQATSIEMHYPPTKDYTIYAYMRFSEGTYWDADFRYFDARTLEEIKPDHIYGDLEQASVADKIQRMNYDIHVGAIGGIAGKIVAFLSSLIVGSLPITGFMIWWGRRQSSAKTKVTKQETKSAKVDTAA